MRGAAVSPTVDAVRRHRTGRAWTAERSSPQLLDRLITEERRRERAIRLDEVCRRESLVPEHVPERRDHHHDGEGKRIARELLAGRMDRVRRLDRIDQHLDDRDPVLPQVRLEGLQVLQFHRTDRAPAREEVHDDGLADEISRREGLAIEGLRLEAGKGTAPELLRDRWDERRVGAIDGQAEGDRSRDQQSLPPPAASTGLLHHHRPPSPSFLSLTFGSGTDLDRFACGNVITHCPMAPFNPSPIRPAARMTSGSGTFFT
jgi:hypothetical protein